MGPMPYGITWLLMLLKVLHNPPRPIGIFIPKSQGEKGDNNHNIVNAEIITELKQGGCSWVQCLMGLHDCYCLMEVLHNPPRLIRIFIPESQGEGDNHKYVVNAEIITELKQGGVHGSNALWDYMVVNTSWRSYIIR